MAGVSEYRAEGEDNGVEKELESIGIGRRGADREHEQGTGEQRASREEQMERT